MALKRVGVHAVVEGLPAFKAGMDSINATVRKVTDNVKKTVGNSDAYKTVSKAVDLYSDKIKDLVKNTLSGIPVIGNFADEIAGMLNPTTLAAVAVAALVVAIVKLGIEGGRIKGVQDSFTALVTSIDIGKPTELLENLRKSVRGTVNDFELMRITNVALAGATGEFAKMFGEALPEVLNLARVQAAATGQDVNYLVESLVTGIKRASPLLIDNTGIVLKVGEANEQLAQKLGKSVEALTSEEKQIAVLNAVLEAGARTTALYGDAQEYANVKFARTTATLQNMFNSVMVAVEPLAAAILDVVNVLLSNISKILTGLLAIAQPIINGIAAIVNAIVAILAPVVDFIGSAIGDVLTTVGAIVETILSPIQLLIEILGRVGGAITGGVVVPFRGLLDFLLGAVNFIVGLARGMLKAGAALIGALSAGILHAANNTLVPAVVAIATLIADFLVGQSPPPKGPLSEIDKGGQKTMEAWIGGFVGASLDPVDKVAAEVTASMGKIAGYSLDQVKGRIKELDAALFPFQDRLAIVKANFEALAPVTDAAFSMIDRQLDKAVQALASGDEAAAQQVRTLDAQRMALEDYIAVQQEQIDKQQIQVALAQAQQAQERVLLGIRQRQLEIDQIKDPVERAQKQKELDAAKAKATGGGEGTAPTGVGGGGFAIPKLPGDGGFIDELIGSFDTAFEQGGGSAELAKLQQGGKLIQAQFDRMKAGFESSPLVQGIKSALEGVSELFNPANPDGFIFKVLQWLNEQSSTSNPNGLVGWFYNLPTTLRNAVTQLPSVIESEIVKPIGTAFNRLFDPANPDGIAVKATEFFKGAGEGTLQWILTAPVSWLQDKVVVPINTEFNKIFTGLFDLSNPDSFASRAWLFMSGSGEGSLAYILSAPVRWFAENVINPLGDQFYLLWDATLNPDNAQSWAGMVGNFFQGSGAGTFQGIFAGVGQFIKDNFGNPFIKAFNGVTAALETFINDKILGALRGLVQQMIDFLASIGDTGSNIVQQLKSFNSKATVSLGRIPELAKGGLMSQGIFQAGERGREIGMSAKPFAMFSNRFVNAIDLFAHTMARPMPLPALTGGQHTTTNNQDSQVNNFYGVRGTDDAARRVAMMRAFR